MPIILRAKGPKFWFYEADLDEPPHVHVGKDGREAKFWLDPSRVERSGRFKRMELREIQRIIDGNRDFLMSAWRREKEKNVNS